VFARVRSQLWFESKNETFKKYLISLPYVKLGHIFPSDNNTRCEACGRDHEATQKLIFFGIRYSSGRLKHPFTADIILNNSEEEVPFMLGQLCYQRVRLYHSMLHFKIRVMLAIKSQLHKQTNIEQFLNSGQTRKLIIYQFEILKKLISMAELYGSNDARTIRMKLGYLDNIQAPDTDASILNLFHAYKHSHKAKTKVK
jgi:hypothetical protein